MIKLKRLFICCLLVISLLSSMNVFATTGNSENASSTPIVNTVDSGITSSAIDAGIDVTTPSAVDVGDGTGNGSIATPPAIDTNDGASNISDVPEPPAEKSAFSFMVPKNVTKFNLGDTANAFLIGNKLMIQSSVSISNIKPEVSKFKEVANKFVYILDVKRELSGNNILVSAASIPAKSAIKLKDNLLFVNKDNPLPENYWINEKSFVYLKSYGYRCSYNTVKVRPDFAQALKVMFSDAAKQGVKNFVCNSGYRTLAYQAQLFNTRYNNNLKIYKNKETALAKTRLRVAYPGTSEHNAGIALDILSYPNYGADTFKYTKEAKWLRENSYKYGFVVRYPENKTSLTYTMYEPWHVRYVGLPYSRLFQNSGLCFEEIVSKLRTNKYVTFIDGKSKYILFYSKTGNLYCSDKTIQRSVLTYKNEYVTLMKVQ